MAPRPASLLVGLGLLLPKGVYAGATLGLNWSPTPPNEDLQSGLTVGEFDGLLQPSLTPSAGWTHNNHLILLHVNWVVFSSASNEARTTLGNLRLGVDYRHLYPDISDSFRAFSSLGFYQLIPLLQDSNPAFSDSEQALSETLLSEQRALLSGTGIRLGFGVEVPVFDEIHLGANHHFVLHMNFQNLQDLLQTNILSKGVTGIHTTVHF